MPPGGGGGGGGGGSVDAAGWGGGGGGGGGQLWHQTSLERTIFVLFVLKKEHCSNDKIYLFIIHDSFSQYKYV